MTTLNKQKPYGTVCGTGVPYHYEQGGKLFNHAGLEVNQSGELITEAPPEPTVSAEIVESGKDQEPESDGFEDLTANELREQLDILEVTYRVNDSKPDLLAMLREELAADKRDGAE